MTLEHINMRFQKGGFFSKDRSVHVLKDIDLTIGEGEILAPVGESGCGKTTLGKIITGLYVPTEGQIALQGESGETIKRKKRPLSFLQVQFIQQDSYAALNPVRTIYQSLYAPIRMHNPKWSKKQIDTKIDELMTLIGLQPAAQFLSKYPHQLSGGQRQRILMARAISLDPKLIVADEPVSMIDVSLRLSLLNLMSELNERLGIAFVYITHDLSTARYIARRGRLAVMYLGEIMEEGAMDVVLSHPRHPYTRALLKAVPVPDPDARSDEKLPLKSMELSGIEDRGEGCPFAPRCPYMTEQCERPVDYVVTEGVRIKCRNLEEVERLNAARPEGTDE